MHPIAKGGGVNAGGRVAGLIVALYMRVYTLYVGVGRAVKGVGHFGFIDIYFHDADARRIDDPAASCHKARQDGYAGGLLAWRIFNDTEWPYSEASKRDPGVMEHEIG